MARTTTSPAAFQRLVDATSPYFVARDTELYLMTLALVAHVHLFMLSVPGAGKTMLIRQFLRRVDGAVYFRTLFDPQADDSLVYGPQSLPKLMEGKRSRESDGYVQQAHFWDADELWNGSSALTQACHELVLERRWKDGNTYRPVELISMFAASNSTPAGRPELAAIWDRVGLRRITQQVTDPEQLLAMYRLPAAPDDPDPVITLDEVRAAHAESLTIPVTTEADEVLVQIVVAARAEGVTMSARRQMEARRIAQAAAWLDGAAQVEPRHLDFLTDYVWEQPGQYQALASIILAATAPELGELHTLQSTVAALRLEANDLVTLYATNPTQARSGAREVFAKVRQAAEDAALLTPKITRLRDQAALADLARHIQQVGVIVLVDVNKMQPHNVPNLVQAATDGALAGIAA